MPPKTTIQFLADFSAELFELISQHLKYEKPSSHSTVVFGNAIDNLHKKYALLIADKKETWMIVCIDNYNRETISDRLVAENIKYEDEANLIAQKLNEAQPSETSQYFTVKPHDYKLYVYHPY